MLTTVLKRLGGFRVSPSPVIADKESGESVRPSVLRGSSHQASSKARGTHWQVNPYLKRVTRTFRSSLASVLLFSFVINLLTLAVPLYLLQIYAKVLPGGNLDTLLILTIIVLAAVLALGLLESVRRSMLSRMGIRFDHMISEHLLDSAINRTVVKSRASVNIMRDLSTVSNFLSGSIVPLLDLPWTPLFLACLYYLHPLLGLVGVLGCLVMLALACLNEYLTRESVAASSTESRDLLDRAQSWVRNADVVHAMGMQSRLLAEWRTQNSRALTASYRSSRLNTRLSSLSKMVRLFLQVAVVCVAAWLIITRQLTPGITIASILLLRRAVSPFEQSIRSWKAVQRARHAYRNISEYLDHASTLESDPAMPEPQGVLKAEKLSFRRSGDQKSLFSRVDLRLEPGKLTALVGPTAVGKSTLLRVLAGIVPPTSGRVTIAGFELGMWSPEQRGPHIGYLPQDVCLFPGSVKDNICRFTNADIEDVIESAEVANAHEMIQKLPEGYETELQEDGLNLSGGQRQRIGLARAVFARPNVIILDEPDANLDPNGRSLLRKTLRRLRRAGVAVLVTTHRSSLQSVADLVYRLEGGKVVQLHSRETNDTAANFDFAAETMLAEDADKLQNDAIVRSAASSPAEQLPQLGGELSVMGGNSSVYPIRPPTMPSRSVAINPALEITNPPVGDSSPDHHDLPTSSELTRLASTTSNTESEETAMAETSVSRVDDQSPSDHDRVVLQPLNRLQRKLARRKVSAGTKRS